MDSVTTAAPQTRTWVIESFFAGLADAEFDLETAAQAKATQRRQNQKARSEMVRRLVKKTEDLGAKGLACVLITVAADSGDVILHGCATARTPAALRPRMLLLLERLQPLFGCTSLLSCVLHTAEISMVRRSSVGVRERGNSTARLLSGLYSMN